MLAKMSVRLKLAGTFLICTAVFACAAVISFWQIDQINAKISNVFDGTVYRMYHTLSLNDHLESYVGALGGYLLSGSADMSREMAEAQARVEEAIEILAARFADDTFEAEVVQPWAALTRLAEQALQASQLGDQQSARLTYEQAAVLADTIAETNRSLVAELNAQRELAKQDLVDSGRTNQIVISALMVGSCILALVFGVFIPPLVTKPIVALAGAAERMAIGDLTECEVSVQSKDELGKMNEAFNAMVQGLRTVVANVSDISAQLASSSDQMEATVKQANIATQQVALAMQEVAAGASDQSSEVEATAKTVMQLQQVIDQIAQGAERQAQQVQRAAEIVENMRLTVEGVVQKARSVAQSAAESIRIAREGGHVVNQSILGMQQISQTESDTAEKIAELGMYSGKVGEIVEVISEIADQTNLLALNAAIEAARAGDHGKGFAVVAEEVRKLAERSAQSAGEIADLVRTIQSGTEEAVAAMEASTEEVQKGLGLSQQAGDALQRILAAFDQVNDQIQSINQDAEELLSSTDAVTKEVASIADVTNKNRAATEGMASQCDRVVEAIENISAVSEETAASAEEVSASTEEISASGGEIETAANHLASMARQLRDIVARYRL